MPMFPLGSVVFPGQLLPLHIFEARYQQMLEYCLSEQREFGVVLIERGHEVGGGDIRSGVGTVVEILEASQALPGHWAVVTVGRRRIRVRRWNRDDPWPNAEVDDLPDEPMGAAAVGELWESVQRDFRRVRLLAARLSGGAPEKTQYDSDPGAGSFQLAALSPLGEFDRQRVLAAVGVGTRLNLLTRVFGEVEETLLAQIRFDGSN